MNKQQRNLVLMMFNPFSIFMLIAGIILGTLNKFPNLSMMITAGIIEGLVFYFIAVMLSKFTIEAQSE